MPTAAHEFRKKTARMILIKTSCFLNLSYPPPFLYLGWVDKLEGKTGFKSGINVYETFFKSLYLNIFIDSIGGQTGTKTRCVPQFYV
jgi:hypothetical protein